MRILAIDVGQTTGMAYTIYEPTYPFVYISWTKAISMRTPWYRDDTYMILGSKDAQLNVLIVEYPLYHGTSSGAKKTGKARQVWEQEIAAMQEILPSLEVIEVRPAEWKQTPSGRIDVKSAMRMPGPGIKKYTEHEKDACKIIHWYCTYKLKRTS